MANIDLTQMFQDNPSSYCLIRFNLPKDHLEPMMEIIHQANGGLMGNYDHCFFIQEGMGYFRPNDLSKPYLGTKGRLEMVLEYKVETICPVEHLFFVLESIKQAHPYEECSIEVIPLMKQGIKSTVQT